ncbi:MAG: phage holin family protein [bacterium]|nr:phage holin family protein [bacterium]
MKKILRHFIIDTAVLYFISQVVGGLNFRGGVATIFLTGAVLAVVTMLVKPLINILLLPLNLITFGFFKWIAHALSLYIVTLVVPDFAINGFHFAGLNTYWFSIPSLNLGGILAVIAFSFLISFASSAAYSLLG